MKVDSIPNSTNHSANFGNPVAFSLDLKCGRYRNLLRLRARLRPWRPRRWVQKSRRDRVGHLEFAGRPVQSVLEDSAAVTGGFGADRDEIPGVDRARVLSACASSIALAFGDGLEHPRNQHGITVEAWVPRFLGSQRRGHSRVFAGPYGDGSAQIHCPGLQQRCAGRCRSRRAK